LPAASRLRAVVSGRVQGVGFRYFVLERARELGLSGWVRNLGEDRVEVVTEGEQAALDALLESLRQGPRLAWVRSVAVEPEPLRGDLTGFSVRSSSW
jgi:acylphosphatase